MSASTLSASRKIPAPDPDIEALKANVFERMAKGAAQVMPLFPHDHAGAVVPCGNVLQGGPEQEYGRFYHWNTVSDVVSCCGSHNSPLSPGQIIATQNLHGVNSRLTDEKAPDAFAVIVVTQHQSEDGVQTKAMISRCEECRSELLRHEYDASPPARRADEAVRRFPTMVGSKQFADCATGTRSARARSAVNVNSPFPVEGWGWPRQVRQTTAVRAAEAAMRDTAVTDA